MTTRMIKEAARDEQVKLVILKYPLGEVWVLRKKKRKKGWGETEKDIS